VGQFSERKNSKDRNLEKLLEYAEICRVKRLLETWINAMIYEQNKRDEKRN